MSSATDDNAKRCPRILLVDDDIDQCELAVEALRMYFDDQEGLSIRAVHTAAEALAVDLTAVDVVLLDYNLPDASGMDVLRQILQRADVPVIFVTGENVSATAAEAIRGGAQDYLVKLGDYIFAIPVVVEKNLRQHQTKVENRRLQEQLQASLDEIRVKNIQLQESLEKLERMAATDHLTGLANRRHFSSTLEVYFSEARRYDYDLTCIMMDLDNYKILNDTLGHQMGDKILMTAAQVIQANLRTSDLAARYGGDEFVCLLPHTSSDLALSVAERIRQQLAASASQYLRIGRAMTMSIGIASLQTCHPTSADGLVALADKALYASKAAGKNHVTVAGQAPLIDQPAG